MIAVHNPKIYFAKDILSHFAPMSHFTPGYAKQLTRHFSCVNDINCCGFTFYRTKAMQVYILQGLDQKNAIFQEFVLRLGL